MTSPIVNGTTFYQTIANAASNGITWIKSTAGTIGSQAWRVTNAAKAALANAGFRGYVAATVFAAAHPIVAAAIILTTGVALGVLLDKALLSKKAVIVNNEVPPAPAATEAPATAPVSVPATV